MFSDRPLRTTESNVRSSGGPGSVSTGTQASSEKLRTVSADARVPCESAKCSSETDRGSADPPKTASRGSANPHKMASKGSAAPSKSAPKGSAGPLKTATSKDDSSSSRCSPTKVRVDGGILGRHDRLLRQFRRTLSLEGQPVCLFKIPPVRCSFLFDSVAG